MTVRGHQHYTLPVTDPEVEGVHRSSNKSFQACILLLTVSGQQQNTLPVLVLAAVPPTDPEVEGGYAAPAGAVVPWEGPLAAGEWPGAPWIGFDTEDADAEPDEPSTERAGAAPAVDEPTAHVKISW